MKNKNRLLSRAFNPSPLMASMHRWKYSALATAAALSVGLYAPNAAALALGPITVQSALGEPLRAEIDLPQITAAEADSLQASTAAADIFRAQGMEYTAIANQVQMKLHRRPDGRSVLRLSGSSPVNDPFVDLVVDARWGSGHITRSYTMLFDPPSLRRTPATVTASAQTSAPASSAAPAARAPAATAPAAAAPSGAASSISAETRAAARAQVRAEAAQPSPATPRATPPTPAPTPAPKAAPRPAPDPVQRPPATQPSSQPAPAADSVTVKPGDTAGRLANTHRLGGVSLDQMLVAMMRGNPDAFIQGNVHRIKAGAVLQLPNTDEAQTTSSTEARQIIALQSRDFNEFRRKLAGAAPVTQQAAAERSATGTVQTRTDDKRTGNATPDKLTLSKGALQGKKSTEEQLAQRKQANEAAARAQELAKNIDELNKLSAASAPAGKAAAGTAALASAGSTAAPSITVPVAAPVTVSPPAASAAPAPSAPTAPAAPAAPVSPTPAATTAEPEKPATPEAETATDSTQAPTAPSAEAAEADAPAKPATEEPAVVAVAPPPPKPAPVAAPEPAPEPSFIDTLMEDPALPLAGIGLLALLLGYGGYRVMQQRRRNQSSLDSSFLDSRAQPDSFFGGSGGQRVDTAGNDTTTGGSSLAFTSSQLDAGGDVDPVAEADVYLAYGRDLQAEEILKEALRHNPERLSVYVKLAEIYAKRQDRKALEAIAQDVQQRTQGSGPDWARVADLGRELDPANALYQTGGIAAGATNAAAATAAAAAASAAADIELVSALAAQASLDDDDDLDLDLDMLDDAIKPVPAAAPISFAEAAQAATAAAALEDDPLFGSAATNPAPANIDSDIDLDLPALDFGNEPKEPTWNAPAAPAPTPAPAAAPTLAPLPEPELSLPNLDFSMDMPDLDLPGLDLPDINAAAAATPAPAPVEEAFTLPDSGMMEFSLDDLSLDLDTAEPAGAELPDTNAAPPAPLSDDPLATKLALAQEFNTIGDSDGARTLIEEVIAESSGELKARAQRLLSELD